MKPVKTNETDDHVVKPMCETDEHVMETMKNNEFPRPRMEHHIYNLPGEPPVPCLGLSFAL